MDQAEKIQSSSQKSILSAVALIGALLILMYAAPMLQEKLRGWSDEESSEQVAEKPEATLTPDVAPGLVDWLPLVQEQLPKNEAGRPIYKILHMRLATDSSQLLVDLQEVDSEVPSRIDLFLRRDEFGRYISENHDIPLKLYPPKK